MFLSDELKRKLKLGSEFLLGRHDHYLFVHDLTSFPIVIEHTMTNRKVYIFREIGECHQRTEWHIPFNSFDIVCFRFYRDGRIHKSVFNSRDMSEPSLVQEFLGDWE